jgi:hypothetical protein
MGLACLRHRSFASYYKLKLALLEFLELLQQYWAYVALKCKNDIMSWDTNTSTSSIHEYHYAWRREVMIGYTTYL